MNNENFKSNDVIQLGKKKVGVGHEPFIIAEMSGNHNQSLNRAEEIVKAAAKAGAHALKLQTYTADTMTIDLNTDDFMVQEKDSLWAGKSLHQLYQEAHTPWEWHEPLFALCKKLGMECFSTPFDATAVDFLEKLNVPFYKIASFENRDFALIEKVADTGKPLIVSTGMASFEEMQDIVNVIAKTGNNNFILLKCTSTYPGDPSSSHVNTIPDMQKRLGCQIGLSDHTLGIGVALASISLGATVIEKHFTLSRAEGGVDAAFSLEPAELKQLVVESQRAFKGLGQVHYGLVEGEKSSMRFRRSLYITKNCKAGDRLDDDNLRAIRPGFGLSPKYKDDVMGQELLIDVKCGTPLSWDMVNKK
ncbi:pseudaminic acid synthase [bacterium K02(2017)]|nr:pseudaminic acid synthase [bacterium K02(2017)]